MATESDIVRNVRSVAADLRSRPKSYVRSLARTPLVLAAERTINDLERSELTDFVPGGNYAIELADASDRHGWSLGCVEQVVLQLLIQQRGATAAFEIGTFNGGTTLMMARALPEAGRVVTLDLPAADFDASQSPDRFTGDQVGEAFKGSDVEAKIEQLRADSLTFDYSPYRRAFDLVLVDGAHDYVHGYADSIAALELVKPGGIIVWDDFEPYWHGLIQGIREATQGRRLRKLAGTSFGILELES